MKQSIKKTFLAIALMLAVFASAQAQTPYRSDFKYDFFSNWTVSASAVGTKTLDFSNFEFGTGTNIGADLRLSKRIGEHWDLRYIAEVPAFIGQTEQKGFDRYGKLLSGVELHPVRWFYLFADAGAGFNPSNINTIGIAADAGLGFSAKTSDWTRLFLELGADRCQNVATNELNNWNSNLFAKLGLSVNLGITEGDYQRIKTLDEQAELVDNLEADNEGLKKTNAELSETNSRLVEDLGKLSETCKKLENDLNECLNSKPVVEEKDAETVQIFFEYASHKISKTESEKISSIFSKLDQNKEYTLDGYCSDSGDDAFNQTLSEKRAESVKKELVRLGADSSKLKTAGHGKVKGGADASNQKVEIAL